MTEQQLEAAKLRCSTRADTATAPIEVVVALLALMDIDSVESSVAYQAFSTEETKWYVTWVSATHLAHVSAQLHGTQRWDYGHSVNHPQPTVAVEASCWSLRELVSMSVTSVSVPKVSHPDSASCSYAAKLRDGTTLSFPPTDPNLTPSPEDEADSVVVALRAVLSTA